MIGYIVLAVVGFFFLDWINEFYKKEKTLFNLAEEIEKCANIKILFVVDYSYKFYLFKLLGKYIVNINQEDYNEMFSKRLHKLSGHLFLIINFTKLDQQKVLPIIKALTLYTNLSGNTLTTYVPYRSKESSSLIALAGKNIVLGNYAVLTNTKIDTTLSKLLEFYYSGTNYKKILSEFYSDQTQNVCYGAEDLAKIKLNVVNEEKLEEKIPKFSKEALKKLMELIDDVLK